MLEGGFDWKQGVRWFLIGLAVVAGIASWSANRKSTLSDADALYLCEETIIFALPDFSASEAGERSYVDRKTEDGFELVWSVSGGLNMMDEAGEQVETIICHVNEASASVDHLEVNGHILFTRKRAVGQG